MVIITSITTVCFALSPRGAPHTAENAFASRVSLWNDILKMGLISQASLNSTPSWYGPSPPKADPLLPPEVPAPPGLFTALWAVRSGAEQLKWGSCIREKAAGQWRSLPIPAPSQPTRGLLLTHPKSPSSACHNTWSCRHLPGSCITLGKPLNLFKFHLLVWQKRDTDFGALWASACVSVNESSVKTINRQTDGWTDGWLAGVCLLQIPTQFHIPDPRHILVMWAGKVKSPWQWGKRRKTLAGWKWVSVFTVKCSLSWLPLTTMWSWGQVSCVRSLFPAWIMYGQFLKKKFLSHYVNLNYHIP